MADILTFIGVIYILGYVSVDVSLACDDIDTSACQLLVQHRPDLCSDLSLANTACKRFCKLCPIECYNCNATVLDYHECNTTMACQQGEVCMRKELRSFVDGHHEYQMTCERKEVCDGVGGVSFPFGKRNIQSRDVSIHCCSDDFCNYPELPTTISPNYKTVPITTMASSGCMRDIIIVVDETISMVRDQDTTLGFIADLVSNFNIGTSDVLVSLATFATRVVTRWDLGKYTDKQALTDAIKGVQFNGGSGDINVALSYVVNHATLTQYGDRPNVPDVVIVITDGSSHSTLQERLLSAEIHRQSKNVITIGIGRADVDDLRIVATDIGHMIKVHDAHRLLMQQQKVSNLICQGSTNVIP